MSVTCKLFAGTSYKLFSPCECGGVGSFTNGTFQATAYGVRVWTNQSELVGKLIRFRIRSSTGYQSIEQFTTIQSADGGVVSNISTFAIANYVTYYFDALECDYVPCDNPCEWISDLDGVGNLVWYDTSGAQHVESGASSFQPEAFHPSSMIFFVASSGFRFGAGAQVVAHCIVYQEIGGFPIGQDYIDLPGVVHGSTVSFDPTPLNLFNVYFGASRVLGNVNLELVSTGDTTGDCCEDEGGEPGPVEPVTPLPEALGPYPPEPPPEPPPLPEEPIGPEPPVPPGPVPPTEPTPPVPPTPPVTCECEVYVADSVRWSAQYLASVLLEGFGYLIEGLVLVWENVLAFALDVVGYLGSLVEWVWGQHQEMVERHHRERLAEDRELRVTIEDGIADLVEGISEVRDALERAEPVEVIVEGDKVELWNPGDPEGTPKNFMRRL